MFHDVRKNKVLVFGLGISGLASCKYLLTNQNYDIAAVDDDIENKRLLPQITELVNQGLILKDLDSLVLEDFSFIILSPGINPHHPLLEKARGLSLSIVGEAEFALRQMKNPVIGVTGTNGKTTVVYLIAHILQYAGKKAVAAGNCGTPLISLIGNEDEKTIIVAELSSFQIETMHSCSLDAALILNITPDHLNRYANLDDYAHAKLNIYHCLKANASLIVFKDIIQQWPLFFTKKNALTFGQDNASYRFQNGRIIAQDENEFVGNILNDDHHTLNFLAATSVCRLFDISLRTCFEAYQTFRRPSHRIEYVEEINGIQFFDDSKGTNIDAVICAVKSFKNPLHLIAGGFHKGHSYCSWIEHFKGKIKNIYAIGNAKEQIAAELTPFFSVETFDSLQDATERAFENAISGEIILLSPGCASYDMFKDYSHRGEVFKNQVAQFKNRLHKKSIDKML